MEGRGSVAGRLAVVAMVLVLTMVSGALAANHVVGGTAQLWEYPPENDVTYYDKTWAANQTFAVGDTLEFKYTVGAHNVVRYNTSAEYTACAGTAVQTWTTGDDLIPLKTAGLYYFICSIPGHCTAGMKLSVSVGAVVAPAPSPMAPAPTPMTPAPAPTTPAPAPATPAPAPMTPAPAPTTPAPAPTTPAPAPTTPAPAPMTVAPAPMTTSPPPPSTPAPPPSAASSGPVLSMAGLVTAALVAVLAFIE